MDGRFPSDFSEIVRVFCCMIGGKKSVKLVVQVVGCVGNRLVGGSSMGSAR